MNYDWIKPGIKVKIKTLKEIHRMYPQGMPFDLTEDMEEFCGTIQRIHFISESHDDRCKLNVRIRGHSGDTWCWPETVLIPCCTKLGNSL